MRIDGQIGYEYPKPLGGEEKPSRSKLPGPEQAATQGSGKGEQLAPGQRSLIQAALAVEDVDTAAVAEAKELLESGQLDTPEAARRAAKNMIERGL
ncbi:MAG: hypothetical protein DRP83_08545 [Planctomycetota bacterium]|nr:MAG: hypothetical protein DRP83_08545 [Planctomycetota bacterium]